MTEDTPALATSTAPNGRAMRIPILVAAIVLGAAAIVLARHYERPAPPTETPAPGMTVGSDSVTLANDAPMWSVVKVAPAEAAQPHWTDPVPARIVFDEARTSRLGSPLAGRVTATFVERGQHVKSGDKLFTVSSPNLAELRADIEKANVERGTAKVNYDRVKALVDAGSLPAKELVTAQQEISEAELAVRLASQKLASLKVAGAGDASFTVTAPRDGVVVEKNVSVGQNVDPSNGSVLAIADLREVWVVADLFETDAGSLTSGTQAKVTLGSSELDAMVDHVSEVVDPDRHTVPVRVKLANPDGALRPNAYAQIQFFDASSARAMLPASAVLSDGARSYVYVHRDGTLKRRTVVIGPATGGDVRVLSGLEPGEEVVVRGAILLDNQLQLEDG
jgi:RND family efflux transporter MFP subunit